MRLAAGDEIDSVVDGENVPSCSIVVLTPPRSLVAVLHANKPCTLRKPASTLPLVFRIPHECSPIDSLLVSLWPSLLLKSPAIRMRALEEYRVVSISKAA